MHLFIDLNWPGQILLHGQAAQFEGILDIFLKFPIFHFLDILAIECQGLFLPELAQFRDLNGVLVLGLADAFESFQ